MAINETAMKGIIRNLERLPKMRQEAEERAREKTALKMRRDFSSARDGAGRPRVRRPDVLPDPEWARVAYFRRRFQLSRWQLDGMARRGEVRVKFVGATRFWLIADVERAFFGGDPAGDAV